MKYSTFRNHSEKVFLIWENISDWQNQCKDNCDEENKVNIIMDFLFYSRNIFINKTKTNENIATLKNYKQNGCCFNCFKKLKPEKWEKMKVDLPKTLSWLDFDR